MPMFSRKCPACGDDGVTQGVMTAPGRPNVLLIVMACGSCGHEWAAEGVQVPEPNPPQRKWALH
jgi:uncharacterized Zn finger protein